MKKIFLAFAVIAAAVSCSESKQQDKSTEPKADPAKDRVALTYKVLKFDETMVSVDAWVKNNSEDSIWFIAPNCGGIIYSLLYDASTLRLRPQQVCEVPEVEKIAIAPHGSYPFHAVFANNSEAEKMRLALDFIEVPKAYDLTK